MSIELINLTHHDVTILRDGVPVTIPPSGTNARIRIRHKRIGTIEVGGVRIPIETPIFGEATPLPDPRPGVFYIASRTYCDRVQRADVLRVHERVRDRDDRIAGAKNLATSPQILSLAYS